MSRTCPLDQQAFHHTVGYIRSSEGHWGNHAGCAIIRNKAHRSLIRC